MNWPLFFSTFALIFFAELGDKTQLAVLSRSAATSARWTVFSAGVAALAASTAIGVLAGGLIRRFVPDERLIKCFGGALFLLFGMLMVRDALMPRKVRREAAAAEMPAGWIGRFVIRQAAAFEQAAAQDYEALAAKSVDTTEQAVFRRLAAEERWHHAAMLAALSAGADKDFPVTAEMAAEFPPLEDMTHSAAGNFSAAAEQAIRHELATARFYRTLSERAALPRLRETFLALSVAEENHARRLMALGAVTTAAADVNAAVIR
ncbi:MAG: TMEM165/GDT1 family protein [Kiritimatiellae bacterium]|nr:TMEM165/GDT1 family protein [Kiritimatiellia bacterium]MDD4025219.1 TMEM165/GDT1 family protein [Kiritimatiellia bacterium]